jgi:predicted nicotinamide N-methyase
VAGFFDAYPRFQETSEVTPALNRLNKRHMAIIEAHQGVFDGASVLDLASHDGRWAFAALKAGAAHAIGIEARSELLDNANSTFRAYGVDNDRFKFVDGDVFDVLQRDRIRADVVLLLGFFYHVARHVELVRLIEATGARYVIVDTAIMQDSRIPLDSPNLIELRRESVASQANQAVPDTNVGASAIVGYPSRGAVSFLFDHFGFDCEEVDWSQLLADDRNADLPDYVAGVRTTFFMSRREHQSG